MKKDKLVKKLKKHVVAAVLKYPGSFHCPGCGKLMAVVDMKVDQDKTWYIYEPHKKKFGNKRKKK